MATRSDVFLDTSYGVALAIQRDEYHPRAAQIARGLLSARVRMVTTSAIVFELGNALARDPFRSIAIRLLHRIHNDPSIVLVTVDDALLREGIDEFMRHEDKSWTLVDCISFVVMRERGISEALTADRHFVQAGFRALLLDDE